MILINVAEELFTAANILHDPRKETLKTDMNEFLNQILQLTTERIIEMKHENPAVENLLTSHLNPGHTLESIWFMIHSMQRTDHPEYYSIVQKLERIASYAIDKGWDDVYGGLFRFVHKAGGKPRGTKEGSTLEKLIIDTWDMNYGGPIRKRSIRLYYSMTLPGR